MTVPISLVNDKVPRSSFTADGSQLAYFCDWPLRTLDALRVVFNDDDTPGIAYSVVGINDSDGFTVTFVRAPAEDTRITIYRSSVLERQNNYGQQPEFNANSVNSEFAAAIMLIQELAMKLDRTIRLPISDPVAEMILPPLGDRAGRYAYFDDEGRLTTAGATLLSILDFGQYPTDTPLPEDLFAFNRVGLDDGVDRVRSATLTDLENALRQIRHRPYVDSIACGMVGDGVTDDSFPFQVKLDFWSSRGGATFMLRTPVEGGSFYFANTPRIPSNCSVLMFSPYLLAKGSSVRIAGALSGTPNANAFKLQIDATAGASVVRVDTAVYGGGLLSTFFAVNDYVQITGKLDGCGTPLEQQEFRVTAVDNALAQLTLDDTLDYDYKVIYPADVYENNYNAANYTKISKLVTGLLTSDLEAGNNLCLIRAQDIGKFNVGDMVLVKSDRLSDDTAAAAGSSSLPVAEEMARIVPALSTDTVYSLRLDRRVERGFGVAKLARIHKVDPAEGATLSGARFLSAEAPDLSPAVPVHWFEMRYALGCAVTTSTVPNSDEFGKRGSAFRMWRSYNCLGENCDASDAKYVDGGEGYGLVFDRAATGCEFVGGVIERMRHSMLAQTATNCSFRRVRIRDPRQTAFDVHSLEEYGVVAYDCQVDGGTSLESNEGRAPSAIIFGNSTHMGGCTQCGWVGGRINDMKAASGYPFPVLRFRPGAKRCFFKGAEVHNVDLLFAHEDTSGFGTMIAEGNRIEDITVDGVLLPRMIDIQGRYYGATVDTLVDTKIRGLVAKNINGGMRAINTTELEIEGCDWDEVTVDSSVSYAIEAESVTKLIVRRNDFTDMGRGLKLTGTSFKAQGNTFNDQPYVTVFYDGGGNTGEWTDGRASGFTGFTTRGGSVLTEGPRLIGAMLMETNTVFKFKPPRTQGIAQFFSTTGTSFFAEFYYNAASPKIDLGPYTSPVVKHTTGALTGTTGTAGSVTISAHTDGTIQIEQRTGADMTVDGGTP